jgi:hypothetical protein
MRKVVAAFFFGSLMTVCALSVHGQDATGDSASKPAAPASKKPKVWTNDSLETVRKPWDEYADQKAASAEKVGKTEGGAGAPKVANQEQKDKAIASAPPEMPKTIMEADQRISEKETEIQYHENGKQKMQDLLDKATPENRGRLQKNLTKINSLLEAAQRDLKIAQAQKMELVKRGTL